MPSNLESLWVVRIGKAPEVARRARSEGFVAIGWAALGDLAKYSNRPAMRAHVEQTFPTWSVPRVSVCFGQVFRFAHEMRVGDSVLLPLKETREIAVGRITGAYEHRGSDPQLVEQGRPNVRTVAWHKCVPRTIFSQAALYSFGSALTVSTSNEHLEEVRAVLESAAAQPPTLPVLANESDDDELEVDEADREESEAESVRQRTEDFLIKAWTRTAQDFEELTAALFRAMGYHARVTPSSSDHGVDVIAHPDPLGVTPPILKIQCKSGTSTIGGKDARELKGALGAHEKGVLISLGGFTKQAEEIARNNPDIVLLDGPRYLALFLDHYDRLDAAWRTRYPLTPVFVPTR